MTEQARIERLTELAQRAWPKRGAELDIGHGFAAVDPAHGATFMMIEHQRALDALEAALHALNGEPANLTAFDRGCFESMKHNVQRMREECRRERERAEAAEKERDRLHKLFDDAGQGEHNVLALVDHYQKTAMDADDELAELRAKLEKLRDEWRDRVRQPEYRRDEIWEWHEQIRVCADELKAVLKDAPVTAAGGE